MEKILRFADVKSATGLSRPTIWRLEHRGEFPRRIQISPGAVGWKWSDIEKWINERSSVDVGSSHKNPLEDSVIIED
jgi:prophage regulatory protein